MSFVLKKRTVIRRRKGTVVIGLMGVGRNSGVTHLGFMLSTYLAFVMGEKVAYVENNNSGCFRQAGIILENNFHGKTKKLFKMISIFMQSDSSKLAEIIAKDFDFVIVDFGSDFENNRNQFLMCNIKIVTGSLSWWNIHKYVGFLAGTEGETSRKSWVFAGISPVKEGIRYLRHEFGIRVHLIPPEPDPFCLGLESLDFFGRLMDEYYG